MNLAAFAPLLLVGSLVSNSEDNVPALEWEGVMPVAVAAAQADSAGTGNVDEANSVPAEPATLTEWLKRHAAAVGYCPVLTDKREAPAASQRTAEEPGCSAAVAIRATPDRWLPWAAGPFIGHREVGPWIGYVLFRGEGGSAGLGVGYRLRMDDGIQLRGGAVVAGMTLSLAGGSK